VFFSESSFLLSVFRDLINAFGANQKKIQQILSKEDENKLQLLLAEEETVSESKQSNAKLIEFLTKYENLTELIKYATTSPSEQAEHNVKFKYSFGLTKYG